MLLGRRRREISSRTGVFLDLLSWRFAAVAGKTGFRPRWPSVLQETKNLKKQGSIDPLCEPDKDPKKEFKRFVAAISDASSPSFLSTAHSVSENLETIYDPDITLAKYPKVDAADLVKPRQQEEDRLLNEMTGLLQRARYHLISKQEWQYARENSYSFSIPTRVRWSSFDQKLVQNVVVGLYNNRSWQTGGDNELGRVEMPVEASRALIFHRGVGMDRTTRLFYGEKVDEAIRRSALWIYKFIYSRFDAIAKRIRKRIMRRAVALQSASLKRSATFRTELMLRTEQFRKFLHRNTVERVGEVLRERIKSLSAPRSAKDVSVKLPGNPHQEKIGPDLEEDLPDYPARISQPVNPWDAEQDEKLRDIEIPGDLIEKRHQVTDSLLESAFSARVSIAEKKLNPLSFVSFTTLQEPTFKDVVVVYRLANPSLPRTLPIGLAQTWKKEGKDFLKRFPNFRNIYVKRYNDVPMADLELLFPEKQVYMSVADRLRFGAMSIVGAAVMIPVLTDRSADFIASPTWIIGVVASSSYLVRVLSRMYMSWAYYTSLTNAFTSENIQASGPAAVESIALDALEQSVKEIAVTYLAMVELHESEGKHEVTLADITKQCQDVLRQKYNANHIHIFDPIPSLRDLYNLEIVQVEHHRKFPDVIHIDQARFKLEKQKRT